MESEVEDNSTFFQRLLCFMTNFTFFKDSSFSHFMPYLDISSFSKFNVNNNCTLPNDNISPGPMVLNSLILSSSIFFIFYLFNF